MTVTLINPFEVDAEHEAGFVEGWKQTAAVFADKPGYLETRLHQAMDPTARFRFVNIAHWSSAQAWSNAMKTFPPREGGTPGVRANPALYQPLPGGTIDAHARPIETLLGEIEDGLARAYQTHDVDYLDRVLADDYVVTDGPGTQSDKAKVLEDHRSRRLEVRHFAFDERRVQRLGIEAAMVTGQYTWDAEYAGHPIAGSFRYLRVYALADSGWRIRAGQVTPILRRA